MGRRGPRPTPKPILHARGSWRAKAGGSEPQFTREVPLCPAHLREEAKAEWQRIAPELDAAGLLTLVDRAALAAYCVAWGRWVEAEDKIAELGQVIKGENGYYQNPHLAVANKALEQMRRFLIEFGLTPAARARVKGAEPKEEEDPFEAFVNRGKKKGKTA